MTADRDWPRRVLVSGVVLSQPMGGVRRHNAQLLPRVAELLARHGASLAVLEGTEPVAFDLPEAIERLPGRVPAGPPIVRAAIEARAIARACEVARSAGRPFDLLHTAHFPVPRRLPLPYTLTVHDLRSLDFAHTPFARKLLAGGVVGKAVRGAAAVITVSETMRARLHAGWRLAPDRVHVVPNAADHFEPLPRAARDDAPLLHVGHLEPRKNVELLLHALRADASLPPLVLAGRPRGRHGETLERLAAELGVTARVRFLGPFDDAQLSELYATAACVVLPSHLEGFGIAALEARRARVPLAVSRAAVFHEIAGSEVPTFAPDDPDGCAAAIRAALRTPTEELEAAAQAAERFRWDRSAEAWVAAWRAALRTTRPPGEAPPGGGA